ncbi:MAG TPA: DUF4097 family beta strand repeat-containing protein [Pyrinomonadaceae bacterium]|jgi:hypothetical protein
MRFKLSFIICAALLAVCASAPRAAVATATGPVGEQTIAADSAVTVMLCVESGGIIVRGWERKEVRARNASGGQIVLRRADAQSGAAPATRIEVLMSESPQIQPRPGECGRSGDIELDVPRGSSVQLKGGSGDIDVTSVANIRADTLSGSIDLRDISRLAEVTTANGDITLERARGRVRLRTISGLIEVKDAGPQEAGDDVWAKTTSGDITLTDVRHAHVEANTAAGSVNLAGVLAHGGFYDLKTSNGDVTVTLPVESSFFLNAKVFYGGDIVTDFPIRLMPAPGCRDCPAADGSKPDQPKGNVVLSGGNLTGVYGRNEKGDATLTLASFSGSVRLRKQQ